MAQPISVAALAALSLVLGAIGPAMGAEFRSTVEAVTLFYDAPSSKSRRLFVVNRGYPVEVMVTLEGWTKVRDAGGSIAWAESRALGPKRMVVIKSRVAEVRTAPEDSSGVAFKVAQSVLLELVEALPSGWVRVRHADAGVGFVRSTEIWGT